VGATVDELRAEVDAMDSDYVTNENTYFLRYWKRRVTSSSGSAAPPLRDSA
jgi:hypothetical protein